MAASAAQEKLDAWEKERAETAATLEQSQKERDRLNVELAELRTASAKREEHVTTDGLEPLGTGRLGPGPTTTQAIGAPHVGTGDGARGAA